MSTVVQSLGILIRNALCELPPPGGRRRPSTKAIYETLKNLKAARAALAQAFGGPVKCRYAGCPPVIWDGKKPLKVLGYLWDLSFSRFMIPEAIEQHGSVSAGRKYEILFVLESELGTCDEICRDLLKLLDARATIRCLIYREPKAHHSREALQSRMIRVLQNHAHFKPDSDKWLFIGLSWNPAAIQANAYTVRPDGASLMMLVA